MTEDQRTTLLKAAMDCWELKHKPTEDGALDVLTPMSTSMVHEDLVHVVSFDEDEIATELLERHYHTMTRPDGSVYWAVYTNIKDEEE